MTSSSVQLEDPHDYLAPGVPFINLYLGEDRNELKVIPDFLLEFYEERYAGDGSQIGTRAQAKFVVFDPSFDFIEEAIVSNYNRVTYSFGWVGAESGSRGRSEPRDCIISYMQPHYEYSGNKLTFELVDIGDFLDNGVTTRLFYEDDNGNVGIAPPPNLTTVPAPGVPFNTVGTATVSGVVSFLANEMGMEADIEPTQGRFVLHQLNETNFSFIRRILLTLASNDLGLRDYQFRVRGRHLLFKRPNYELRRRYWYGRDLNGTMISFEPHVAKGSLWSGVWSDRVSVGFSPLDKRPLVAEIDAMDPEKQDKKQIPIAPNTFVAPRGPHSIGGRLHITPYEGANQLIEFNRAKHRESWFLVTGMKATVIGDPDLSPNDMVEVIMLTPEGNIHYTSGVYKLIKVTHKLRYGGSFVTEMEGVRDGTSLGGQPNFGEINKEFEQFYKFRDSQVSKRAELTEDDFKKLLSSGGQGGLFGAK